MSINMTAFATSTESNDLYELEMQAFNYNRDCDRQAGIIIEKYDTALNGENDTDYVKLATSMSEQKDERISAMNMILVIYDKANESEQLYLKACIESYAPYTDETELNAFCQYLYDLSSSYFANYARDSAVNYAKAHYSTANYNPAYPNISSLGGDCANFVSQCLLAGGKPMEGDWYIYRKNNVYNKPTSSNELDYSWNLANPSPWISAKQFNNYWSKKCSTYEYSTTEWANNYATLYYQTAITKGDVIQLLKPVLWWYEGFHTMLIVGQYSADYIYAAHTSDKVDGHLVDACKNSSYSKYHIKFFKMI